MFFRAWRGRKLSRSGEKCRAEIPEIQPVCKALRYWDEKSEDKILRTMTDHDDEQTTDGQTVKNDTISYGDSPEFFFFLLFLIF